WRETILSGLLGADVIGLQTPLDVSAFLDCAGEILGLPVDRDCASVEVDGRKVRVRAYPASVEPRSLRRSMTSRAVSQARERLALEQGELNVIRVDRLDPSKNQLVGFHAFGRLLELHPELCGRARFQAFLVPSRTDLSVYRAYRDAVYALIEQINNRF